MNDPVNQTSVISAGSVVTGHLFIAGRFHIDGTVKGEVRALDGQQATLIIGETGCVEGNIDVNNLVVHGMTKGSIKVGELIEIMPTAKINSDIFYSSAKVHSGAVIHGRLQLTDKAQGVSAAREKHMS
jgi:cytoskeletal protein CcmA (bactofilin family)